MQNIYVYTILKFKMKFLFNCILRVYIQLQASEWYYFVIHINNKYVEVKQLSFYANYSHTLESYHIVWCPEIFSSIMNSIYSNIKCPEWGRWLLTNSVCIVSLKTQVQCSYPTVGEKSQLLCALPWHLTYPCTVHTPILTVTQAHTI